MLKSVHEIMTFLDGCETEKKRSVGVLRGLSCDAINLMSLMITFNSLQEINDNKKDGVLLHITQQLYLIYLLKEIF